MYVRHCVLFDFKDAEPILVKISQLNIAPPSDLELDELLIMKEAELNLKQQAAIA